MTGMSDVERRRELGQQFRVDSVRMSAVAKSGHPTSGMSAADLMAVLADGYLRYDFDEPKSPANDRLVFSKGHASTLLYAMYRAAGAITEEELLTYRTLGSRLEGHPTPLRDDVAQVGRLRVMVELADPHGVDRGADGRDAAVGQHGDLVDPVGVQRRDGTACRGAETDHHRAQPTTVVTRRTGELERLDHRAVPGELVVLVEHVQPDRAVDRPVIHRLERDHGQAAVDGQLGDLWILHAVRPAPEHRAGLHRGHIGVLVSF